jgi:chromosome segregation ATPase
MSDSDDTQALVANIQVDGAAVASAAVASAPAPHEYPTEMLTSSSEEEEANPTLPVKKRKTTGRLTRRKMTTRRVSGASDEAPSPGTANNLLEGRVNDLEGEMETLQGKLAQSEDGRKQAKETIFHLNKQAKLLKEELKVLGAEESAKEVGRLKGEVAALTDASTKATRLGEELTVSKATVKDLRTQVSKGISGYSKLLAKYNQLKKDAKKEEASFKKEISTLKAEANDKAKQLKQDEAKVDADKEARKTAEYKLDLKMKREDERRRNNLLRNDTRYLRKGMIRAPLVQSGVDSPLYDVRTKSS